MIDYTMIVQFSVVTFSIGVLCWIALKSSSKMFKILMVAVAIVCVLAPYPFWKYQYALNAVSQAFDKEQYALASERSNIYLNDSYYYIEQIMLGNIIGHTPRSYFLITIALCEYEQRNYDAATRVLNELVEYASASPYPQDQGYANMGKRLLDKISSSANKK